MKDFRFKIPQNIEFGMGSLKKLPEILKENEIGRASCRERVFRAV